MSCFQLALAWCHLAYIYIYIYIYTVYYIYIYIILYNYIYTCIYIHTYIHACIHTYIHTSMHPCMHTYIHTYIHTYRYTHVYMIQVDTSKLLNATSCLEFSGVIPNGFTAVAIRGEPGRRSFVVLIWGSPWGLVKLGPCESCPHPGGGSGWSGLTPTEFRCRAERWR